MTKEDAVTKPGPVYTRRCQDENESANAADSCGSELYRPDVGDKKKK